MGNNTLSCHTIGFRLRSSAVPFGYDTRSSRDCFESGITCFTRNGDDYFASVCSFSRGRRFNLAMTRELLFGSRRRKCRWTSWVASLGARTADRSAETLPHEIDVQASSAIPVSDAMSRPELPEPGFQARLTQPEIIGSSGIRR